MDRITTAAMQETVTTVITSVNGSSPSTLSTFIDPYRAVLDMTATIIMTANTISLMLGMGSATCWRELWHHLKKPIGCIIGMAGQFLVLPVTGFGLSVLFGLRPYEALGVLIISCSPGGSFSNFFTYWCDGDLALSIMMTTCSSLLAFGGMPFNLWLYSKYWINQQNENQQPTVLRLTEAMTSTTAMTEMGTAGALPENPAMEMPELVIPYMNIMKSLVFVAIPVVVGMIIRHRNKRVANIITKVSGGLGWLGCLVVIVIWLLLYWKVFVRATQFIYLVAVLLPVVGFLLAYILAKILCQDHRRCRTIGIETGSQNMPVALSIILLSFHNPLVRSELILFPTLYGVILLTEVFVGIGIFQCYKRIRPTSVGDSVELPKKHANGIESARPAETSNLL